MKHLFTSLSICIIAVSLTACDNQNEAVEKSATAISEAVSDATSNETKTASPAENTQDSSVAKEDTNSSTSGAKAVVIEPEPEKKAATDNVKNKPLNLNDFRSAIGDVVQDSLQEDVEKSVENEVSKKADE